MAQNSPLNIDKSFVSVYDKFLAQFDATHPLSASQLQEKAKSEKIQRLRDNKQNPQGLKEIWTEF